LFQLVVLTVIGRQCHFVGHANHNDTQIIGTRTALEHLLVDVPFPKKT